MARGVDQIQRIRGPVRRAVVQPHGAGLDGDAALALEIHVVQDLILHHAHRHGVALLDQPVGKGGLAMVDMGDNGKIADVFAFGHTFSSSSASSAISALSVRLRRLARKARAAAAAEAVLSGFSLRQSR